MNYRSADQALRRYWQLWQQLADPPAFNLALMSGDTPAEACAQCHSKAGYVWLPKKGGEIIRKCRKCAKPWPMPTVDIIKGQVRINRRVLHESDRKQTELAYLGKVLRTPPIDMAPECWRFHVGLWNVYVNGGQSLETVAREFSGELRNHGRGISRESVRRVVGAARRVVSERLRAPMRTREWGRGEGPQAG